MKWRLMRAWAMLILLFYILIFLPLKTLWVAVSSAWSGIAEYIEDEFYSLSRLVKDVWERWHDPEFWSKSSAIAEAEAKAAADADL